MRRALALLALTFCASAAAAAQPSEDRYGPRRAEPVRVLASNSAAAAYQGRMLTWSSRAFTPQVPESAAVQTPPVAVAPAPMASRPAPAAPVARQIAVEKPVQAAIRAPAPAQALPDSLYAPPPPAAAPQKMAAVVAPATPGAVGSPPRLYSVHRQYGMSPDAIPATPGGGANYVLIAPREGVGRDEDDKPRDDEDRPF